MFLCMKPMWRERPIWKLCLCQLCTGFRGGMLTYVLKIISPFTQRFIQDSKRFITLCGGLCQTAYLGANCSHAVQNLFLEIILGYTGGPRQICVQRVSRIISFVILLVDSVVIVNRNLYTLLVSDIFLLRQFRKTRKPPTGQLSWQSAGLLCGRSQVQISTGPTLTSL